MAGPVANLGAFSADFDVNVELCDHRAKGTRRFQVSIGKDWIEHMVSHRRAVVSYLSHSRVPGKLEHRWIFGWQENTGRS